MTGHRIHHPVDGFPLCLGEPPLGIDPRDLVVIDIDLRVDPAPQVPAATVTVAEVLA